MFFEILRWKIMMSLKSVQNSTFSILLLAKVWILLVNPVTMEIGVLEKVLDLDATVWDKLIWLNLRGDCLIFLVHIEYWNEIMIQRVRVTFKILFQPGKPRLNSASISIRNEFGDLCNIFAVLSKSFIEIRLLFIWPASWSNIFNLTNSLHENSFFSLSFFVTTSLHRRILFGFAILCVLLVHFHLTDCSICSSNSLASCGYLGYLGFFNIGVT